MADKKYVFKSFLSVCDKNDSVLGSPFLYKRIRQLNKDKCPSLKITDVVDGQAVIESFANSCDINNIVQSMSIDTFYKLVSDMQNAVQFIDSTKVPTNVFEMENFKYQMQDKFNSLPLELKEMYDNNYYKFIDSIENGSVNGVVKRYFNNLYGNRATNNDKGEESVNNA